MKLGMRVSKSHFPAGGSGYSAGVAVWPREWGDLCWCPGQLLPESAWHTVSVA